ncbi:hypothetical protein [Breznakiella homolactica]|uniref:Uncharacterized protein n=1 Tax=Breznakiella homolactica TaxID=2798577 RepID=A0A7T7XLM6_9SPIR|nr:hypothetical protein [Breznakiella homolactica]QQO08641.1 hypothetical protein JFL75_17170 [Breznakiella homolactica]
MKRKYLLVLFICIGAAVFAQSGSPAAVLSAGDVDAFIKNFESIQADLEKLGPVYENFAESFDPEDNPNIMAQVQAMPVPAEIKQVFRKNGLGDNGWPKMIAILLGASAIYMEDALKSQEAEFMAVPQMAEYFEQLKLQVKMLKDSIHPSDIRLIDQRKADLIPLIENA